MKYHLSNKIKSKDQKIYSKELKSQNAMHPNGKLVK